MIYWFYCPFARQDELVAGRINALVGAAAASDGSNCRNCLFAMRHEMSVRQSRDVRIPCFH